jgi:hypothetical protein
MVPKAKGQMAVEYANKIYNSFESNEHCLGAIMLLLSDIPETPLLEAQQANKASVLGLTTLGFVLNDSKHGKIAHKIATTGQGVIILRVAGSLETPRANIETFDCREKYLRYLKAVIKKNDLRQVKNSTLVSYKGKPDDHR